MRTSRRQFFRVTVGGLVAVSGVGGQARSAFAQGPTVKIGTAVLGDFSLVAPIVIAIEKGFFKAQGGTAEFQPLRGGPDLVKDVAGGRVQVGPHWAPQRP